MKSTVASCLCLSLWMAAGCASRKPVEPGPVIGTSDARALGYRILWNTDMDQPHGHQSAHAAVLGDLLVVVESPSNLVTAFSVRDGSFRWREVIGTPLDRLYEPVRYGDHILINSQTELYSIDGSTGEVDQVQRLEAAVRNRPVLVGSDAIFGAENGMLFWHDVRTGFSRQRVKLSGRMITRPVLLDATLFVADGNGMYAMYDVGTANLLWTSRVFDSISAQPAVGDHGVFLASEDHTLYALHSSSGDERWKIPFSAPLIGDPSLIGSVLYQPVPQKGLLAIDAIGGRTIWQANLPARPILHRGDTVMINTGSSLSLRNIETGQLLAEVPVLPLQQVLHGPDQSVVLITRSGRLVRLDRR